MKVVWTFDPFDKNNELHLIGKKLLISLFNRIDSLEAVYIASNAEVELATAFSIPIEERYTEYPKKLIKNQLKKLSFKNIHVEVVFEKSLSLTATVQKIVNYSKINNIDLIVTATNSKLKLPQFMFGGFAESLVHISKCDLLTYHQKSKVSTKAPANIIYAHDFSLKGERGLCRLIEYVNKWGAVLTIVHVAIPDATIGLQVFKNKTKKYGDKLEIYLTEQKVKYNLNIVYKISPIAETLFSISKKINADIIAVTAQSNKLTALLGGSVTRQVLRGSQLPTLVLKV